MLLKSLKLKNIRSYSNLELEFPKGSSLLSGDIGSGKTTILVSIEFALFGLIRGSLSGSTLLRHGKQEGFVELCFESDKKEIIIMRALKRSSSGINQDAGFISINGVKTDGTAVELKSKIIELLGYPQELVSKSKSLIFRYTVYTPQEEMKQILFESPDERLEKLRKIFDIDKYKRIKENAATYAKDLRSWVKVNESTLSDVNETKKQLSEVENLSKNKAEEKKEASKKLIILKEQESSNKNNFEKLNKDFLEIQRTNNEIKIVNIEIKSKTETSENYSKEVVSIVENISKGVKEENVPDVREVYVVKKEILIAKEEKSVLDEKILKGKKKLAVFASRIKESNNLTDKIDGLTQCPTCNQKVDDNHKIFVKEEEAKKISEIKKEEEKYAGLIEKAEKMLAIREDKIQELNEELKQTEIVEFKKKEFLKQKEFLDNQEKRLALLRKRIEELREEIIVLESKKENLQNKLKENTVTEDIIKTARQKYELSQTQTKKQEIAIAQLDEQQKNFESEKIRLKKEIDKKTLIKKEIDKTKKTENWLSNQFINVVGIIEKHVLASIHQDFNENFQNWFNTLMDDESINATLDGSFTPLIQQNGYDTEIANLSGGEKTSVALAYRLALNKVINDFIGTIKTRDIIILDEPTDGFSSDQLDKVREVLEELNCKQTIIVSHEPKMESFVENVIRISKNEHESKVIF